MNKYFHIDSSNSNGTDILYVEHHCMLLRVTAEPNHLYNVTVMREGDFMGVKPPTKGIMIETMHHRYSEDGTDTWFRNVGTVHIDAGEITKRTFTIFKSRRKLEIYCFHWYTEVQGLWKVTVHLQKVLEVMSTNVYTGLNPL
jgi:hypothetical protein